MAFRNLVTLITAENATLSLDTIESFSRKNGRFDTMASLFNLKPIQPNSRVSAHLKNKIAKDSTITSGFYAPNAPFNFVAINKKGSDYKFASFISYGLKNYKTELTNADKDLLDKVFTICPITCFDVCFDSSARPNIEEFKQIPNIIGGYYKQEVTSHYINNPTHYAFNRILLYDKAMKDDLGRQVWRLEFRMPLNSVKLKDYEFPSDEVNSIIRLCTKH